MTFKGKTRRKTTPKKPTDARSAAPWVRKFVVSLFYRDDGRAADWPAIAETLLLEAFRALDQMPNNPRVHKLLRRMEGGVYARLTAISSDPYFDGGPAPDAPLPDFEGPQQHFSE